MENLSSFHSEQDFTFNNEFAELEDLKQKDNNYASVHQFTYGQQKDHKGHDLDSLISNLTERFKNLGAGVLAHHPEAITAKGKLIKEVGERIHTLVERLEASIINISRAGSKEYTDKITFKRNSDDSNASAAERVKDSLILIQTVKNLLKDSKLLIGGAEPVLSDRNQELEGRLARAEVDLRSTFKTDPQLKGFYPFSDVLAKSFLKDQPNSYIICRF